MTTLILWLLDRVQFLFRAMGADYGQLRAIVQVKLMMDNRRSFINLGRFGRPSEESNNAFIGILGVYAFVGSLFSLLLLLPVNQDLLFLPLTLQFSYIMVLCAMTLISDFSSVILDSSDNQIILPRPVSSRTLWLARIVHISSYLFAIALSLSITSIFIVASRFGGMAGLLFLVTSLLSAVLMVFLTNVFYLVLMRFVSEEKLREVINYFQIVMAILFYGGYQLLPRMIEAQDQLAQSIDHQWWHYLVPPMWMAGAVEMIAQPAFDATHLVFLLLALIAPIAGLWFMNRFLTTDFTQKLSGLDQENRSATSVIPTQSATDQSAGWLERLAGGLTSNPLEQTAFTFAWRVTGRDRKFKLKTYPQLGFGLAYVLLVSTQRQGSSSFFYLFALYFASVYIMVAQYQLGVSDNYRAAWIYGSTPIEQPGDLLVGALKALIIKLLTPFYILLSIYILYRYHVDKIGDVLLAYSNSLVLLLLSALFSTRYMPFSTPQDALKQNNTARGIMISLLLAAVGFLHFGLTYVPYGVWIGIPLSASLFIFLLHRYRKTGWEQIEMA